MDGAEQVAPAADGRACDAGPSPAAPYADAFRRYLLALERRDFTAALRAIDEAASLEPGIVEPYHHRALVWLLLGDDVRSSQDRDTCVAIDGRYQEREAIKQATRQLAEAYRIDEVLPAQWDADTCQHAGLRAILEERSAELQRRRVVVSRPSCDLPCPSICCYFEDETITYGVSLSQDEVAAVRDYLRTAELDEQEYIGHVDVRDLPEDFPAGGGFPQRTDEDSERLYFARRKGPTLAPEDDWRPRTLGYADLTWANGRSRACAFVGPTGCAIHDVGSPPGLAACRSFICLTAFVCLLLRDLGLVMTGDFAARAMAELREFALSALPLVEAVFTSPDGKDARQEMRRALERAVASDRAGEVDATERALAEYRTARERAAQAERRAREPLEAIAGSFVERGRP